MTLADAPVDSFEGRWWPVVVRGGFEKQLARDLASLGISYFLPLEVIQRSSAGQRWTVHQPVWPGYVFICDRSDDLYVAQRQTRGVILQLVPVLSCALQRQLRNELSGIQRILSLCPRISSDPFTIGSNVVVMRGPFRGFPAVVDELGEYRLIVKLTFMGSVRSVSIDPSDCEPV